MTDDEMSGGSNAGKGVLSEAGGVFQELTDDADPGVGLRFRISVWEGGGQGNADAGAEAGRSLCNLRHSCPGC